MTDTVILSIDQGTTSSRAILFTPNGEAYYTAQKPLTLFTPQKGWIEQDPLEIWNTTLSCIKSCIDKAEKDGLKIAAIGITNQRETTILWNKDTGEPLYNAIVWQDRRTADAMRALESDGHAEMVREKSGLLLDPYFSASKVKWIIDQTDHFDFETTLFGTVDTYLLWHLTGGRVHATDTTNASRTLLYNIHKKQWDSDLCALFDVPADILPDVCDTAHHYGDTDADITGHSLPILAIAGDQQAALIGQNCFECGEVKSTYGTGCFMVMNTGTTPRKSHNKLLTTIGYTIENETTYALEGSIFTAGSLMQWLRDDIELFDNVEDTHDLAQSVSDNGGVYIVPALIGLGAPHWNADAAGIITGLTRGTTKAHIVRAALEAQAYQTHDLITAMAEDSGHPITAMRVDGGLTRNGFAMQFMADILDLPVHVPDNAEATAWGAAKLAGFQAGVIDTLNDSATVAETVYTPDMDSDARETCLKSWQDTLEKVLKN